MEPFEPLRVFGLSAIALRVLGPSLVLVVLSVLGRLGARLPRMSRGFEPYVELRDYDDVSRLPTIMHEGRASLQDLQVTKGSVGSTVVQLVAETAHMGERGPLTERFREFGCVYCLETL